MERTIAEQVAALVGGDGSRYGDETERVLSAPSVAGLQTGNARHDIDDDGYHRYVYADGSIISRDRASNHWDVVLPECPAGHCWSSGGGCECEQ